MWKIGDKCSVKTDSGVIIPNCEITWLSPKTSSVKIVNLETQNHWMADQCQLSKNQAPGYCSAHLEDLLDEEYDGINLPDEPDW